MSQCLECHLPFRTSQAQIGATWLTRDICERCREKYSQIKDRAIAFLISNTNGSSPFA